MATAGYYGWLNQYFSQWTFFWQKKEKFDSTLAPTHSLMSVEMCEKGGNTTMKASLIVQHREDWCLKRVSLVLTRES